MVKNLSDSEGVPIQHYLEYLGEEWSDKLSFQEILNEFFWPNIDERSVVAELGSGGGRLASRIVLRVGELQCFDISKEMLKRAESAVKKSLTDASSTKPTSFIFMNEPVFPPNSANTFDFVYAFDVFPHVDLHTQWRYYQEFERILKPGGKAIIHTANLEAPLGWQRFSQQDKFSVGGFYFMVPSMVLTLIKHTGLQVVSTSFGLQEKYPNNTYYNRDFIVLVQKLTS